MLGRYPNLNKSIESGDVDNFLKHLLRTRCQTRRLGPLGWIIYSDYPVIMEDRVEAIYQMLAKHPKVRETLSGRIKSLDNDTWQRAFPHEAELDTLRAESESNAKLISKLQCALRELEANLEKLGCKLTAAQAALPKKGELVVDATMLDALQTELAASREREKELVEELTTKSEQKKLLAKQLKTRPDSALLNDESSSLKRLAALETYCKRNGINVDAAIAFSTLRPTRPVVESNSRRLSLESASESAACDP